ncbi:MAG TPA: hypothetical protein DEO84_03225, partial [candidate division Zixibacteria bacterium]|nr:hypothetical protein [candidate division Zixibacteria bacterium]
WASLVIFAIVAGVYLYFQNQVRLNAEHRFFISAENGINSFVSDIGDKTVLKDPDLFRAADTWLRSNSDFSYVVVTDTTDIIVANPLAS